MASSMFALFFLHVWLQNGDVPRSTHTLKAHCATPPLCHTYIWSVCNGNFRRLGTVTAIAAAIMPHSRVGARVSPAEDEPSLNEMIAAALAKSNTRAGSAAEATGPMAASSHCAAASELICEDASGPAGQLIVTLEEGHRSVV